MTTKEKTKGICAKFHGECFRIREDYGRNRALQEGAKEKSLGDKKWADGSCCHHQQLMVSANERHSRWCFVCLKIACLGLIDDASGGVEVYVVAGSLYCGINETGADGSSCHHQQLMVSANECRIIN